MGERMEFSEMEVTTIASYNDEGKSPSSGEDTSDQTGTQTIKTKKQTGSSRSYRYKDIDDINILKEVLLEKPFGKASATKWREILQRLGIPVKDYIAIKKRFDHLLKSFKADNLKSLRGSGLEEDYDEKCRLLTDIVSQVEDWKNIDAESKSLAKQGQDDQQKRAQLIREAALVNLADTEDTPRSSKRARHSSIELFDFLKASEEKESNHKTLQFEMEQKRLELMERELKVKEENETHRREMERNQLELDKRRLDMEEQRLQMDRIKNEKESEEKFLLLSLLRDKLASGI